MKKTVLFVVFGMLVGACGGSADEVGRGDVTLDDAAQVTDGTVDDSGCMLLRPAGCKGSETAKLYLCEDGVVPRNLTCVPMQEQGMHCCGSNLFDRFNR